MRIANLVMASLAVMFFAGEWVNLEWVGSEWAGKPPFEPPPLDAWTFLRGLIVLIWLSGAIGLFYRRKLALVGSLVGLGSCALLFGRILVIALWLFAFPDAEMKKIQTGEGYGVGELFVVTLFGGILGISVSLFVKLVRSRKEMHAT